MRGKELILAEVSNVPIVDRREAIELAKLEVLLDIRFNLDRINQTLKDIGGHLEMGVTVYTGKL